MFLYPAECINVVQRISNASMLPYRHRGNARRLVRKFERQRSRFDSGEYHASTSGQVTLERRALIAQATGEDWRGVKLQLATTTPARNTRSPQPRA